MNRVGLAVLLLPAALGCARERSLHVTADPEAAVVALLGDRHVCSATIIAVRGSDGFALTAAHCVRDPVRFVVEGEDRRSRSARVHPVTATFVHPRWDVDGGSAWDIAVVRFSGADAATPTLAPAEDDNLAPGTALRIVGFGDTPRGGTFRRHASEVIASRVDPWCIEHQQRLAGPCRGDSGGPALRDVGGALRIVGVTSEGDRACRRSGASSRVSAAGEFLAAVLAGTAPSTPPAPRTCAACLRQVVRDLAICSPSLVACDAEPTCAADLEALEDYGTPMPASGEAAVRVRRCAAAEACAEECTS